jgi:hypothetical protein
VPINREQGIVYSQTRTEEERAEVAEACVLNLNLAMPMALDDMSNAVDTAYAALPERLYLIDEEGRIKYRSGPGPWGFDMDAWDKAIQEEIEKGLS